MAKTNYTKVEEALAEGLRKIDKTRLLEAVPASKASTSPALSAGEIALRKQLIAALHVDLAYLLKEGFNLYGKEKITKNEIKKFKENPAQLSSEEWEKIKKIKENVDQFKKELEKKIKSASNDDLIEKERRKHVTKRFNVNEKWLPLK